MRDRLLGVAPGDYDIATSATVPDVARLFRRTVDCGARYGVLRVLMLEGDFEVSTFRMDGPYLDGRHPATVTFTNEEQDAQRRDFTINALFLDPESDAVIDYVGGVADLEAKVLRAVGDPKRRFEEDHLRLLRAIRFAARLGYAIEAGTWVALCQNAGSIVKTSPERIREELCKCLCEGGASRALRLMDESGLLRHVLPEVHAMKGVEQPEAFHPEGDVFVHTLLLFEHLKNPSATLAFGALLHDVGKPSTQTMEDRIRFNNHDKVGAEMAETLCKRLRFSNEETERICWLVAHHMRVAVMPDMRENKRKRLIREEGFDELLALCRADCLASHGDLSGIEWVESYRATLVPEEIRPPRLLTGNDLIALGYAPGPRFREILLDLEDRQLDGSLHTREEALEQVREQWPVE